MVTMMMSGFVVRIINSPQTRGEVLSGEVLAWYTSNLRRLRLGEEK